jgi:hypothetical protein
MRDLSESWGQNGATVLARVAKENPSGYFSVSVAAPFRATVTPWPGVGQ